MKKQKKMMKLKKRSRIDCIKIPGFEGMPIATDTMLCPNCKSIIGCFAGRHLCALIAGKELTGCLLVVES